MNVTNLFKLVLAMSALIFQQLAAAEDYAYCVEGKAFQPPITEEIKARVIPGYNPDDPQDLAVILAHYMGMPEADQFCQMPTAKELGLSPELRCAEPQDRKCMHEGDPQFSKPRSIPSYAYFASPGQSETVRCQCGCFTAEMNLLTSKGWTSIGELAALANGQSYQLILPNGGETKNVVLSRPLLRKDFTVGPEYHPVIFIETESRKGVYLTTEHPVLVRTARGEDVVQAQELKVGDVLVQTDGSSSPVSELSRHKIETVSGENEVYNVDTGAQEMARHFVSAQGLVVGDVVWQNTLSSRKQREDRLLRAAQGSQEEAQK